MTRTRIVWRASLVALLLLVATGGRASAGEAQQRRLLRAVSDGKVDALRAAVAAGGDVNGLCEGKHLPLHYACEFRFEMVEPLLALGADPARRDPRGRLALNLAVQSRDRPNVMLLLRQGAPVEAHGAFGSTALHYAAHYGEAVLASLLLQRGAEIDAVDDLGRTPLHRATALMALRRSPTAGILDVADDPVVLRFLIAKGAEVDARDIAGRTPLLLAAGRGNLYAARALLEHGADLAAVDGNGEGVARFCVLEPDAQEGLAFFLERGVSATEKTDEGWDLLNTAAELGRPLATRALLAHGVPPDAPGPDGQTPLARAAHFGKVETVLALLDGGADVTRLSGDARGKLSAWRGVDGETLLHLAAREHAPRAVSFLLSLEIPVDATTSYGATPLHWAGRYGGAAIARALLEAGAEVHARNEEGETPLIRAAGYARRDVVALLLERGADPNLRDAEGQTALHHLSTEDGSLMNAMFEGKAGVLADLEARKALYAALVEAGADPEIEDAEGRTAEACWAEFTTEMEQALRELR